MQLSCCFYGKNDVVGALVDEIRLSRYLNTYILRDTICGVRNGLAQF